MRWRPRDLWNVAAVLCLFGGSILLVVAWYDVSGTADVYEQLPYLVSAGFSGLALIIVGSALLAAGRADRVERRLAQLVEALTDATGSDPAPATEPATLDPAGSLLVTPGGTTYHRPGCLLILDKPVTAAASADLDLDSDSDSDSDSDRLTACPVCDPQRPSSS